MTKLTPVERGVLLALVAEGQPLREAGDLKARFNINMAASHRKNLKALGLINTTPNPFTHELTDQGWNWAASELTATVPPGMMGLGPLYALLHGIDRALRARSIDLRTFFTTEVVKPSEPQIPDRSTLISDAAWSASEVALAYAMQDIPSFQRVLQRFDASSPQKQTTSLRQVELAAESIFQNLRLAASKRSLRLSHVRGAEAIFDPVAFDSDDMLSGGEPIKVAKSPVIKTTQGEPIVVAKGVAEPA
ncbi:MAG: hypothetical protein JW395_4070 [Nitrospira sp.]|nr:hypothetical protein [Nitrospira sp.]